MTTAPQRSVWATTLNTAEGSVAAQYHEVFLMTIEPIFVFGRDHLGG